MADQAALRRRLGRELRKAREAAGLTQRAIGGVLGCGQAKINKIESTVAEIDPAELDLMLDAYRVSPGKADELRALAGESRRRGRAGPPPMTPEFAQLSDLEQNATELLSLHSERIPGPLQSELYMLRQFGSQAFSTSDVVELVERRQARTTLFTVDNPPRYRAILSESSLLRMPGGRQPDLEVDQIEHLLTLVNAHAQLELRLLPFTATSAFVGTDFVLAQFDGEVPDFAYVEYPGGGTLIKARKNLTVLLKHWNELYEAALGRDETIKFLDQMAVDARHRWQAAHES
ncbi:MAG TPA: helix-turn-helix transcriptional regulator [Actinophytocola sp.]|uniref:helix-turn-helix domain-containing protein n=1 Tax=Actinophytocola sp. TaxID=1872138 RepID=UPI002E08A80F|nr:helix-turn-helix transcriptional regulator [Actinophytocola sp.]